MLWRLPRPARPQRRKDGSGRCMTGCSTTSVIFRVLTCDGLRRDWGSTCGDSQRSSRSTCTCRAYGRALPKVGASVFVRHRPSTSTERSVMFPSASWRCDVRSQARCACHATTRHCLGLHTRPQALPTVDASTMSSDQPVDSGSARSSIGGILSKWYALNPDITRLWAFEARRPDRDDALDMYVVVAIGPVCDSDDIGPIWLARSAGWRNDLQRLIGRPVLLDWFDGDTEQAPCVEGSDDARACVESIAWRDSASAKV
jgi:hypothetical protein